MKVQELAKNLGQDLKEFIKFLKEVNIDSKIISVKTSKVIGTADFSIKKSADVANLIATVILSSSQQKEELEKERQKILQDIESERADKLAGLQFEEKQLKQKIVDLEREYREKSVVLKEYKVQQEKLNDIDDEIAKIYRSIDRASNKISSLKIGMTPKDIKKIIGKRFNKSTYERHAIVGKYILVFEEGVLVKGCKLGEEVDIGYSTVIVDGGVQCSINGTNIIKY